MPSARNDATMLKTDLMKHDNSDSLLISDLIQQKRVAHQRLLERYGPMVFRLVLRIVGRQEDAEEVYQDVFFKALSNIKTYDQRQASLATWLSHIAYHESLNFVRRTKPVIVSIDETDMTLEDVDMLDENLQSEENIRLMEQALDQLPPHEQALLTMFYYDNLSLSDIAYVTGSIPSTVGSRLSRIRKKLYKIIKTR